MIKPEPEEKLHEDGLIGHLTDLRNCVLKAGLVLLVIFFALVPFTKQIYDFFALPLIAELPAGSDLIATGVISPFLVPVKVTFMVAFCICLPYLLYQAWKFIAPGLYSNEKRFVIPLVASSTLLFLLGMAFAYFLVFKVVFAFVIAYAPGSVNVMPDVQSHLSFAITLFLSFGLAFEVPVAVFILVRLGTLEIASLRRARPYVFVGAFIVAAVVTPPDVISQFMLAIPVWLLYELGILVSAMLPGEGASDDEDEASDEQDEADDAGSGKDDAS